MKQLETAFKVIVLAELRKLPRTWLEKIQQTSIRGTPDILACFAGKFVAIELKRSAKARLDRLQKYKLNEIKKAGGIAMVAYPENWPELSSVLRRIAEGGPYDPDEIEKYSKPDLHSDDG